MTVGQRIAQKRKELGLSQEGLGDKLGVSRQAIYKWESDASLPEVEKLVALSRIFSVPVGWLLGEEEHPSDQTDSQSAELTEAQEALDAEGLSHIHICPETMGKINQLGDLDEVLALCQLDERLIPCIDFGHLYARSLGRDDGEEAMARMLDQVAAALGQDRASRFHSHFSHIEFTLKGGEKCHRTFEDDGGYGPDWTPLARQVALRGWSPTFICESAGTQARDAREMKRIYQEFL